MSDNWETFDDVPLTQETAPDYFLDYFYPIYFSIGMRIASGLMEPGKLDRHQTVIMWILRSETLRSGELSVSRKDVVRLMTVWYDITNSGVSRALRALSKDPMNYISLEESPNSGREKMITLTPRGQKHCADMMVTGRKVIKEVVGNLSTEESKMTIFMFRRLEEEVSKIGG